MLDESKLCILFFPAASAVFVLFSCFHSLQTEHRQQTGAAVANDKLFYLRHSDINPDSKAVLSGRARCVLLQVWQTDTPWSYREEKADTFIIKVWPDIHTHHPDTGCADSSSRRRNPSGFVKNLTLLFGRFTAEDREEGVLTPDRGPGLDVSLRYALTRNVTRPQRGLRYRSACGTVCWAQCGMTAGTPTPRRVD